MTDIRRMVETPALFFKRSTARSPHTRVVAKSPAAPVFQHIGMTNLAFLAHFFCSKDTHFDFFTDFGLAAPILKALQNEGYDTPTAIQAQAIPSCWPAAILGIAQTGTGKTAAFALPILHRLAEDRAAVARKGCRVLVLFADPRAGDARSPTASAPTAATRADLRGGVRRRGPSARRCGDMACGVDVLVATPGRLHRPPRRRQHSSSRHGGAGARRGRPDAGLGFLPAIRRIVSHLTTKRQSLFFSATMPREIGKLADELLRDPARVSVAPVATAVDSVDAARDPRREPQQALPRWCSCCATRRCRARSSSRAPSAAPTSVARYLETPASASPPFTATRASRSASARSRPSAPRRCRVLVATDIAARGIDIDEVTPRGKLRAAERAGEPMSTASAARRAPAPTGIAISLCDAEERGQLRDIEKLTRLKVPVAPLPEGFQAGPVAGERDEPREPRRQQQAQRPRSAPHARGNQGHGAPRVSDPNADRGPKRHRPRGAKPAGATSGNGQRQQQPARASASEGRGDGRQVSWLDKGPRGR